MKDKSLLLKELTGKNEQQAQKVAEYLVNNADIELYKMLVDKTDYLFPFVRSNIEKRLEKSVTGSNFRNLIKFFDYYSDYYDGLFAELLAKHADEDLTDGIFELLEHGTTAQKAYAAKYFAFIPDTIALETLSKYAFSDDENLSANAAEALGQMQDDVSFDIALDNLESNDDFEKLKAVKFFCAYGRNYPFKEIFNALQTSGMPENIAGQIPYMESLLNLLDTEYKESTIKTIYYIISGLGEILPLADIFQFELKEVLAVLVKMNKSKNESSGMIAAVLLKSLSKFKMFNENEEYTYDEDRETKNEIQEILKNLEQEDKEFWENQGEYLKLLLDLGDEDILISLPLIAEFDIHSSAEKIKGLISCKNEVVICESLNTLKILNALENIDLKNIIAQINNPNIKALIETFR